MARPTKDGMDYFTLDTNLDVKFQLIEAKHGLVGFALIIKLLSKIYEENGYFYPWTEREQLLFCKQVNVEISLVNAVITSAVEFKMFDKHVFDQCRVLTSGGIQKRYFYALKRKKSYKLYSDILLINPEVNPEAKLVILSYCNINDASGVVNVCNNPVLSEVNACNNPEKEIGNIEIGNTEIEKEKTPPDFPATPNFVISKKGFVKSLSGSGRIEVARQEWNRLLISPQSQRTPDNFTPDDLSECIRTINSFSDEQILEAISNYAQIQSSSEHELSMPYGSFQGFIKSGVDKFISASKPLERYKKRTQGQKNGKRDMVTDVSDIEF